ncbi:porin [Granulicella cerasi]|uniref:Porin n=1 Tax=Granulicella cerasi TaxID=741063 RepID=A0ABW1Z4W6_9BACT|nr:porin [Granulicella cerasi]
MKTLTLGERQRARLLILMLFAAAVSASAQTGAPSTQNDKQGFLERFVSFYRTDWSGVSPSGPGAPRRGVPSPLNSPPFPSADWSYGGSPTIGESDGNVYPLQTAINGARTRTKVYGWIEPTANLSTSRDRNYPETNDIYSNRVELGQAVVYVERLPDSVQRDHIDWGFHLTGFFGTDYRSTTNKGYFSSQLLDHNRQYGFDPVLEYVDIYFPHVGRGMNLRVGRYISIPGIEAQLTPNNYMFSHSLLYAVDPFTDTGALATIQLNDRWTVQAGVSAGHDVAPWTTDAKPAFTGCVSYTTQSVNDNFYLCANGINDGKYAFNNLQMYDATWYHKIGSTWHLATEVYSMSQRDVPSINGSIVPEKGTNGANCRLGLQRCFAPEWAAVNYVNKQLSPHDFISLRTDFLNDKKGQRTGHATKYSEETLMWSHWIGTTVQIRPELRFDHAWDRRAYDNGTRTNQFTVASDVVFHF